MQTSLFKNSDQIKNLPSDDEELSAKEKTIMDMLYPSDALKNLPQDTEKAWFHFKDVIIATLLFILLSLPASDKLLEKVVKTDNFYYRIASKSLIFAVMFFFINNFYLSRR